MFIESFSFDDVKEKVFECHILNNFDEDFYDHELVVGVCGYIRDELKFSSLDALIEAIQNDCKRTVDIIASEPRCVDVRNKLESI